MILLLDDIPSILPEITRHWLSIDEYRSIGITNTYLEKPVTLGSQSHWDYVHIGSYMLVYSNVLPCRCSPYIDPQLVPGGVTTRYVYWHISSSTGNLYHNLFFFYSKPIYGVAIEPYLMKTRVRYVAEWGADQWHDNLATPTPQYPVPPNIPISSLERGMINK